MSRRPAGPGRRARPCRSRLRHERRHPLRAPPAAVARPGWRLAALVAAAGVSPVARPGHGQRAPRPTPWRSSPIACSAGRCAPTWPASSETIVLELRLPRVLTGHGRRGRPGRGRGDAAGRCCATRWPTRTCWAPPAARPSGRRSAVLLPLQVGLLGLGLGQLLAFVGALLAVALVWRLSRASRLGSLTGLLLTGYAVGSLLAAGLAMAMYLVRRAAAPDRLLPAGQLRHRASWQQVAVAAPLIVVGGAVLAARARAARRAAAGRRDGRPPGPRRVAASGPSCSAWRPWSRPPRWPRRA